MRLIRPCQQPRDVDELGISSICRDKGIDDRCDGNIRSTLLPPSCARAISEPSPFDAPRWATRLLGRTVPVLVQRALAFNRTSAISHMRLLIYNLGVIYSAAALESPVG